MENSIYAPATLDLVRVSAEYCRYLEECATTSEQDFCRTLCALLPMVYLKTVMLPPVEALDAYVAPHVTEEDYNYVRRNVNAVLRADDDYLDVQVEDFKYSEQPVLCTVSENLADIYQQLRDLAETFREGHEEAMQVCLYETAEEFRLSWGAKLLAALRTLHNIYIEADGAEG
ncbi:MAG: DUF5063 domain-containing protein [Bacteroidaceae bacterium]|nr:DUF5063 domain-containing protein [Bacteroidaceae bacterium]